MMSHAFDSPMDIFDETCFEDDKSTGQAFAETLNEILKTATVNTPWAVIFPWHPEAYPEGCLNIMSDGSSRLKFLFQADGSWIFTYAFDPKRQRKIPGLLFPFGLSRNPCLLGNAVDYRMVKKIFGLKSKELLGKPCEPKDVGETL